MTKKKDEVTYCAARCGQTMRVNLAGDGVEGCNDPRDIVGGDDPGGGGGAVEDFIRSSFFGVTDEGEVDGTPTRMKKEEKIKEDERKEREGKIIDV